MTRRPVLDIVAEAKAQGWTVVLGGPESANYPAEYLAAGTDVVVVGEGETTMEELLPALAAQGPHKLHGVAGTVFRDENGTVVTNALEHNRHWFEANAPDGSGASSSHPVPPRR